MLLCVLRQHEELSHDSFVQGDQQKTFQTFVVRKPDVFTPKIEIKMELVSKTRKNSNILVMMFDEILPHPSYSIG